MSKEVYWGSIEYTYNSSHSAYPNLKGGIVYAFFLANDVRDFSKAIEEDMKRLCLCVEKIEFVNVYDWELKWENDTDTERYKKLVEDAKSTSHVVFDDFYAYES